MGGDGQGMGRGEGGRGGDRREGGEGTGEKGRGQEGREGRVGELGKRKGGRTKRKGKWERRKGGTEGGGEEVGERRTGGRGRPARRWRKVTNTKTNEGEERGTVINVEAGERVENIGKGDMVQTKKKIWRKKRIGNIDRKKIETRKKK